MLSASALRQSPPISSPTTTSTPVTGLKRKTEDDLASEQRLAKRFHLLNLGKSKHQITAEDIQKVQLQLEKDAFNEEQNEVLEAPRLRRSRSNAFSDSMNVDESRDRIFIHNLEDELADLSSDEEHPIFIPDIERRLNMIPKSLLRPDHPPRSGNELVLYEVPSSLTIPIEQDSTRKAILESRRRAQEQALLGIPGDVQTMPNTRSAQDGTFNDGDAMDIS